MGFDNNEETMLRYQASQTKGKRLRRRDGGADDWHFSERLGKWLLLVRSKENPFRWQDVILAKLAGDRTGHCVMMLNKDPNYSKTQDLVAGRAVDTPREAAIRCAK